jgi:hypothetical protein
VDFALLCVAATVCWLRFRAFSDRRRRLLAWACAFGPIAVGALCSCSRFHPLAGPWIAGLASLAAAWALCVPAEVQGIWLSLVVFSFCQPLLNASELCFAGLSLLVAWGLSGSPRPAAARWRGLEVVVVLLWAYATPGGGLDLSHIGVQEIYLVLGRTWSVPVLAGLLVVKHIGAVLAPVVALLTGLTAREAMAAAPLFGFWSGGNLFVLWFEIFFVGMDPANLLNEHSFEMSLWAALFAWTLAAASGGLWLWGALPRRRSAQLELPAARQAAGP